MNENCTIIKLQIGLEITLFSKIEYFIYYPNKSYCNVLFLLCLSNIHTYKNHIIMIGVIYKHTKIISSWSMLRTSI